MYKNINLFLGEEDINIMNDMLKMPPHIEIANDLSSILETDSKGRIIQFMPTNGLQWNLIFFLQNLMIRQRLFEMDKIIDTGEIL